MQFTEVEAKLIRLALNSAAHEGETSTAGGKLLGQLRKRGVTAEQLMAGGNGASSGNYESLWRMAQINVAHYQAKVTQLQAELDRLRTGTSTSFKPNSTGTRRTRTKFGAAVLSAKERDFIRRFGSEATRWGGNSGSTLRSFCQTHQEFGTIQQVMRKGMVEKRGPRRHGLTEAGIAYYARYCGAA